MRTDRRARRGLDGIRTVIGPIATELRLGEQLDFIQKENTALAAPAPRSRGDVLAYPVLLKSDMLEETLGSFDEAFQCSEIAERDGMLVAEVRVPDELPAQGRFVIYPDHGIGCTYWSGPHRVDLAMAASNALRFLPPELAAWILKFDPRWGKRAPALVALGMAGMLDRSDVAPLVAEARSSTIQGISRALERAEWHQRVAWGSLELDLAF